MQIPTPLAIDSKPGRAKNYGVVPVNQTTQQFHSIRPSRAGRSAGKFTGHGLKDPHIPSKMTGCGRLRSGWQAGVFHMPKQAPESCGNGPRIGLDEV
jgi:hypothetical protein